MFQGREGDVAVDLLSAVSILGPWIWGRIGSYVLFHVLLSDFDSALAHLEAHLRRVIVHETAKGRREAWRRIRCLLLLAHVSSIGAIVVALLRLRWWW